jgi:hypothetical protein
MNNEAGGKGDIANFGRSVFHPKLKSPIGHWVCARSGHRLAPVTNCMELPRMITGQRQSDRARFLTSSAALWHGNY